MNDKLLAEYCGITWHMVKECRHPVLLTCMNRCICGRDVDTHLCVNPDFSTPEGYEMLHRAINERSGWYELYEYITELHYSSGDMLALYISARNFHELPCADKAQIISDWLGDTQ